MWALPALKGAINDDSIAPFRPNGARHDVHTVQFPLNALAITFNGRITTTGN